MRIVKSIIAISVILLVVEFVQATEIYEATVDGLRVRSSPSTSSEIKGSLKKGNPVHVVRIAESHTLPDGRKGNWVEIRNWGISGFVSDIFLRKRWSSSDCAERAGRHSPKVSTLLSDHPAASRNRILFIDKTEMSLYVFEGQSFKRCFVVGLSAKPMNNKDGSDGTPLGAHKIHEKSGASAEKFRVFTGRKPDPKTITARPNESEAERKKALVLSRVIWITGLERKNRGNHSRWVYLHGTNREHFLGFGHNSGGCIRMMNDDVIELFRDDSPLNGTLIWLQR